MMTNTCTDSEHSTAGDRFIFVHVGRKFRTQRVQPISFSVVRVTVANMTADTFLDIRELARFLMGLNEEAGLL